MSLSIAIAPGDGIGPEVMAEAGRLLEVLSRKFHVAFDLVPVHIGGEAALKTGFSFPDSEWEKIRQCGTVLLGAVGGPRYAHLPRAQRPEAALLALRSRLDTFANIRPARCFDALVEASTLKSEIISGLDLVIVRELTSGVYFGTPRGVFENERGERFGVDTQRYTQTEVERVLAVSAQLARQRSKRVCSVDKSNVMESGKFWADIAEHWFAHNAPDIELSHMLADNCAMQLVRDPKQFDVIVTDNLFGDILSDCAAMLTGSLGMLPSASLARLGSEGVPVAAIYEPVHGTAPDIAGQGKANPLAMIQCVGMLCAYTLQLPEMERVVRLAVQSVLEAGLRTPDIATSQTPSSLMVGTRAMGDALVDAVESA